VLHFTPTSSSRLNLVERWFAELTTKKPPRRAPLRPSAQHRHPRLASTENPKPFVWTKTADQILESISRYCTRTNDSRH
jgi:hypothetical protein